MTSRVPLGVEGFRLGSRHDDAELLAARALHLGEPVGFLVAEFWNGGYLLGDERVIRFHDVDAARADAAKVRDPYRVGVLAVVPVDHGRLYPVQRW